MAPCSRWEPVDSSIARSVRLALANREVQPQAIGPRVLDCHRLDRHRRGRRRNLRLLQFARDRGPGVDRNCSSPALAASALRIRHSDQPLVGLRAQSLERERSKARMPLSEGDYARIPVPAPAEWQKARRSPGVVSLDCSRHLLQALGEHSLTLSVIVYSRRSLLEVRQRPQSGARSIGDPIWWTLAR